MSISFYFFELIIFTILIIWFVLLPGMFLISKLRQKMSGGEFAVFSLNTGIVFLTLIFYLFSLLKVGYTGLTVISALNIYFIWPRRAFLGKHLTNLKNLIRNLQSNAIPVLILLSGTVVCGTLIFKSGWDVSGTLLFTEFRDAMWHLGLMKELVRSVPPFHPGFSPVPLTNYHYFTHLFGAFFLNFSIFNEFDFYFRIFPVFLTFLYGLNLYQAGKCFLQKKSSLYFLLLLGYFASSFAYLLPLFLGKNYAWHESSFWLSQPFSMVINPSFSLSASLLLMVLYLLNRITVTRNKSLILPLILIAGSLIEFKVYAGILALAGMFAAGIWFWVLRKEKILMLGFLASAALSVLIFFPASGGTPGNFLTFLPGWFLRSMVESPDRAQYVDWVLREETYLHYGNWLGVLRLRAYEMVIYLVGNFGVRIIAFVALIPLIVKPLRRGAVFVFGATVVVSGTLIPLVFVQNGSIANTLQFSYYALIFTTLGLCVSYERYLLARFKNWGVTLFIILVIISLPTSVKHFLDTWKVNTFIVIPKDEVEAFNFMRDNSQKDDLILVPVTTRYTDSLFVSTLSSRRVFYTDRLMAENTLNEYKKREQAVNDFFANHNLRANTSFLVNNGIKYIYLDNAEIIGFNPGYYPVNKVYQKGKFAVYKVYEK